MVHHEGSQAGACRQEWVQRPWNIVAYWLLLALLYKPVQPIHSGLGPPTSTINKENAHRLSHRPEIGGNFSVEAHSSKMTLDCGLAKGNSNSQPGVVMECREPISQTWGPILLLAHRGSFSKRLDTSHSSLSLSFERSRVE